MKFNILNRFTGAVQFTAEIECTEDTSTSVKLGLAVKWAIKARANLAGADLASADLARAYLADAYLAGANLAGANLAGAYLADAYLARADLAGANLADANLADAYLARADLARADLAGANLAGAYLAGADLAGADLAGANLAGAYLARADLARANLAPGEWIVKGATRSDGYTFLLMCTKRDGLRIRAGCRYFTLAEANAHWNSKRPAGSQLGDETREIINSMFALAHLRGLVNDQWEAVEPKQRAKAAA